MMDITNKIHAKLKKILKKLKGIGIIQTFKLEIDFCQVEEDLKKSLTEIDSLLKKCLKKIINKPKRAEFRNIISELVRKKNFSELDIANEPVKKNLSDKKGCFTEFTNNDTKGIDAIALKFQCGICKDIFSSKKNFIFHKRVHTKFEKYLCEKCGKIFYDTQKCEEHEDKYTNEFPETDVKSIILTNENKICEFPEFLLKQSLVEEELNNSVKGPSVKEKHFTCQCGKIFRILKSYKKHVRLKHSSKNIKYDCDTCGKTFIEKGKLNRHMLSHKDRQYSCSVCEKRFSRSDTLKRHVLLFHCTQKAFSCGFCHKKFTLKYNRNIHEENVHKNVTSCIQCEQCSKKFKNKISHKSHLKSHSKDKITCTACSKSFARNSYFKIHMKKKHFSKQ